MGGGGVCRGRRFMAAVILILGPECLSENIKLPILCQESSLRTNDNSDRKATILYVASKRVAYFPSPERDSLTPVTRYMIASWARKKIK